MAVVDRTRQALADIVAAIDQVAAHVAAIDLHAVDADAAGQTAQALAVPLRQLTQLRQSLLSRRSRL